MRYDNSLNHYQVLGIDMSADLRAVRDAMGRLAEEADALAYMSPDRSRALWERIREIKGDLLSGSESRYAYDRQLLSFAPSSGVPPAARPAPHPPMAPPERHTSWLERPLPRAAGVVVAVALAVVGAFLLRSNPGSSPAPVAQAQVPGKLAMAGDRSGSGYRSGHVIAVTWAPVTGAQGYRLQVKANDGTWRSLLISGTSHAMTVVGPQTYAWRVQARTAAGWQAFTRIQTFKVAQPNGAAPIPLSPANGAVLMVGHVDLCWSGVDGATSYHLRIRGIGGMNIGATCRWETLPAGRYRWTVAARLRGAGSFLGSYSAKTYFTIRPELAVVRRHHHRSPTPAPQLAALVPTFSPAIPVVRGVAMPLPGPSRYGRSVAPASGQPRRPTAHRVVATRPRVPITVIRPTSVKVTQTVPRVAAVVPTPVPWGTPRVSSPPVAPSPSVPSTPIRRRPKGQPLPPSTVAPASSGAASLTVVSHAPRRQIVPPAPAVAARPSVGSARGTAANRRERACNRPECLTGVRRGRR